MNPVSRRWAAAFFALLCLCARILVAQPTDSVYVSFSSVAGLHPLATVGGILHADDCDSVRILSLVFTWHSHFPPYQVQPLDWAAGRGQNVPKNFPLPPTAPGFPEDAHLVYVVYPDGSTQTLDIDPLVAGRSYALAPGCPPVPVQLSSFIGTIIGRRVRLDWTTVSEVNNYGFFVQKKRYNEAEWLMAPNAFVAGHGTTTEPQHYTFWDDVVIPTPLRYRLKQMDLDGTVHYSEQILVGNTTEVKEVAPKEFALEQNYPNPFNPSTEIRYQLSEASHVTLKVYDVLGREVADLQSGFTEAGYHGVSWNALNSASGVYILRFAARDARGALKFNKSIKLLLAR